MARQAEFAPEVPPLMSKISVLVLSKADDAQLAQLNALLDWADFTIGDSAAALEEPAVQAKVILNWSGSLALFREIFVKSPAVRWVHSRSVGLERTLFTELIASNAVLTNGSGVFSPSLGEFALAAVLYFAKDFRRMVRNQMSGRWEAFDIEMVSGKTLGIVGYGDIGRAVASRAGAMGMKVLALKRHASPSERDPLVARLYGPEGLKGMLGECDYVIVATPLTAETRGLISGAELRAMKKTSVIINLGRGPVIDEPALIAALSEHRIRGAALDVFDQEPLPEGHPFYKLENVLLSPHCADHTPDWLDNAMRFFVDQFHRFRRGEPLLNVVEKNLGY